MNGWKDDGMDGGEEALLSLASPSWRRRAVSTCFLRCKQIGDVRSSGDGYAE